MKNCSLKKLEYGETPWDNLSREELLFQIKRMYSALYSDLTVIQLVDHKNSIFQEANGPGKYALEKTKQIIDEIHNEYSPYNIYSMYFKYANDLLFDSSKVSISSNWCICPLCGELIGDKDSIGKECGKLIGDKNKHCHGILRPITWEDLKPVKPAIEDTSKQLKKDKDLEGYYRKLVIECSKLKDALKNTSECLVNTAENPFQNEAVLKVLNINEELLKF